MIIHLRHKNFKMMKTIWNLRHPDALITSNKATILKNLKAIRRIIENELCIVEKVVSDNTTPEDKKELYAPNGTIL